MHFIQIPLLNTGRASDRFAGRDITRRQLPSLCPSRPLIWSSRSFPCKVTINSQRTQLPTAAPPAHVRLPPNLAQDVWETGLPLYPQLHAPSTHISHLLLFLWFTLSLSSLN